MHFKIWSVKSRPFGLGPNILIWNYYIVLRGKWRVIFKCVVVVIFMTIAFSWVAQDPTDSGNGLVPSGNKPLPEWMMTQILYRYMASLGLTELKQKAMSHVWNWLITPCCRHDMYSFPALPALCGESANRFLSKWASDSMIRLLLLA